MICEIGDRPLAATSPHTPCCFDYAVASPFTRALELQKWPTAKCHKDLAAPSSTLTWLSCWIDPLTKSSLSRIPSIDIAQRPNYRHVSDLQLPQSFRRGLNSSSGCDPRLPEPLHTSTVLDNNCSTWCDSDRIVPCFAVVHEGDRGQRDSMGGL